MYYEDEKIKGIEKTNDNFQNHTFVNCNFENCNLSNSDFSGSSFEDCIFQTCDLSFVKIIGAKLIDVQFIECTFRGVNFSETSRLFMEYNFERCILNNTSFFELNLDKLNVNYSPLKL